MGFEDRDYFRESSGYSDQFGSWGFNLAAVPPACKYLVAANIIVFLLQIFITRPMDQRDLGEFRDGFPGSGESMFEDEYFDPSMLPKVSVVQKWAELDTRKVVQQGQVWRLLTCAFCHERGGIFHILFNMLFLWWFGKTLEMMYGSREFLLFYLTAAVVASLAFVGLDLATGSTTPAIGASGAVMAVTMLYALFYPRQTIRIMFFFPIEIRWLVLIYVVYDLHPVLLALSGDQMYSGVGHAAHLGGLAFGFAYWKFNFRLAPMLDRLPQRQTRRRRVRKVRTPDTVAPSRQASLDEQVDHILQKIHEQGKDALTDSEERVLQLASQRYKQR